MSEQDASEDFGEPIYVEAHGGKNHVILYQSRKNPNLAVEFFFRSCSKDGRSKYYRCTKCWYLYKINRGTCATLIVRDGRIITDPENPLVPHQCDFRSLESVAVNRAWISQQKRKRKVDDDEDQGDSEVVDMTPQNDKPSTFGSFGMEECSSNDICDDNTLPQCFENNMDEEISNDLEDNNPTSPSKIDRSMWTEVQDKVSDANFSGSIDLACGESLGLHSPSTSPYSEFKYNNMGSGSNKQSSGPPSHENAYNENNNNFLEEAFAASLCKNNDEALEKLQQAVETKENFDVDDISLLDNVFSYKLRNTTDIQQKMSVCEEWLKLLTKIVPIATSRWLSHYQFSFHYVFHMLALLFRKNRNDIEKKRFFGISLPIFKSIYQATLCIPEPAEDVTSTKLDVLLSLSFIALEFYQFCDDEIVEFIENEAKTFDGFMSRSSNSSENVALMLQKIMRIEGNLEDRARIISAGHAGVLCSLTM